MLFHTTEISVIKNLGLSYSKLHSLTNDSHIIVTGEFRVGRTLEKQQLAHSIACLLNTENHLATHIAHPKFEVLAQFVTVHTSAQLWQAIMPQTEKSKCGHVTQKQVYLT